VLKGKKAGFTDREKPPHAYDILFIIL